VIPTSARWLPRLWPRSLFGRLTLILFSGLFVAHVLNFELIVHERTQVAEDIMFDNLATDVMAAVALLERVPAAERSAWLSRLEHRNYRYLLETMRDGEPIPSAESRKWIAPVARALGSGYTVTATRRPNALDPLQFRLHLRLSDGTPFTVDLSPVKTPHSVWVQVVMTIQLVMLAVFTWIAVRLATRPLVKLAKAADAMGPDLKGSELPEEGPQEVARAAVAFNSMQRRITDYLAERIQILAAVSHDLQTPITRMRLRADLMDDSVQKEKFHSDLSAMQVLVEQGIAYARSAHDVAETPCRTDLDALLDSLVCDYVDAGQPVRLNGRIGRPLMTRPHTLRRIIANLTDNALKFGRDTEIMLNTTTPEHVQIIVRDRGPGIPEHELKAVLQPYYRVESSRNRESGGTGLGLAIAQQLTVALGGTLLLSNREGGGLEALLSLPVSSA
jgi:signal transduction histidine kinase